MPIEKTWFTIHARPIRTSPKLRTGVTRGGCPVLFIHNPKTAGTSLRDYLRARPEISHAVPFMSVAPRDWHRCFSICAVRHPIERVASGYLYHIKSDYYGALYRRHGAGFKDLSPVEYVALVRESGNHLLPQCAYLSYPSRRKPSVDLVLRYESIDTWSDTLRSAGVLGCGPGIPKLKTTKGDVDLHVAERLGLSQVEYGRFADEVRRVYFSDFEVLGYS